MDSLQIERTVVAELMLEETKTVTSALTILREYDFTDFNCLKIFQTIKKIIKERKEIDIILIGNISGVDSKILLDIQNSISTTANMDQHICDLRNATLKRKFITGATSVVSDLEHSIQPADDIINFATKLVKLSYYSLDSLETTRRTVWDDVQELERGEPEKKYSFGIKFLNDALNGYHRKDVIVIASRSGRGKSELCNIIAEKAAIDGQKVLFLALEAEKREIGARIKFRALCRKYFIDNPNLIHPVSFDKWMSKQAPELDQYNNIINEVLETYAKNIFVQYRNTEFTVEDLNQQLNRCKDVDVIVLDHIHYVDILEANENKGLKKIIKCIRTNNLLYKKPIIIAAHLRKTNKKEDGLTPDEDDIFGSSDLQKIVTKTILFSPDYIQYHDYLYPTFFRAAKCRRNPSALRYTAKLYFDSRMNLYQDKYKLARYFPFAKEFLELEKEKYPNWTPMEIKYDKN